MPERGFSYCTIGIGRYVETMTQGAMIHGLSLCTGVGCIDLGFKRFFSGRNGGPTYSTVHYVEREAYCAEILARRMEEGHLDMAPIWDDIQTYNGSIVGCDIIASGLPCQPYSVAGKGGANGDSRALWPHFLRIVREARPAAVLLENVPGFIKHFGPVYAGLREMGFDVEAPLSLGARDCAAPHKRERLFIFASHPERRSIFAGLDNTDPDSAGSQGRGREALTACSDQRLAGAVDKQNTWLFDRLEQRIIGRPGTGHWETESPVLGVANGTTRRVDSLRAIGNGVVPQVVERALAHFMNVSN